MMPLPLAQQTHFRAKHEHAKQNTVSKRRENISRKVDELRPRIDGRVRPTFQGWHVYHRNFLPFRLPQAISKERKCS